MHFLHRWSSELRLFEGTLFLSFQASGATWGQLPPAASVFLFRLTGDAACGPEEGTPSDFSKQSGQVPTSDRKERGLPGLRWPWEDGKWKLGER